MADVIILRKEGNVSLGCYIQKSVNTPDFLEDLNTKKPIAEALIIGDNPDVVGTHGIKTKTSRAIYQNVL